MKKNKIKKKGKGIIFSFKNKDKKVIKKKVKEEKDVVMKEKRIICFTWEITVPNDHDSFQSTLSSPMS